MPYGNEDASSQTPEWAGKGGCHNTVKSIVEGCSFTMLVRRSDFGGVEAYALLPAGQDGAVAGEGQREYRCVSLSDELTAR